MYKPSPTLRTVLPLGAGALAFVLVTHPALAKSRGQTQSAPAPETGTSPIPLVTDGSLNIHDWILDKGDSDEFDGKSLDTRKWNPLPRQRGWNFSWRESNVSVSNGKLRLEMKYQPNRSVGKYKHYTTGIIVSRKPFLYGFFQARIKGAYPQPGTVSAFWLSNHATLDDMTGIWTEIDILEALERTKPSETGIPFVTHAVHVFRHPDAPDLSPYDKPEWGYPVGSRAVNWNPFDQYHVYGLEWTPREIKMYVDGHLQGEVYNRWWHNPLFLIFSLELRPPFRRHPSPKGFPGHMSVDYVRIWTSAKVQALKPLLPRKKVLTRKAWLQTLKEPPSQ